MRTRQEAYAKILEWGLLAIREAAWEGKTILCEIEADHIHNLPSLLNESNELRHLYYIQKELPGYLNRLEGLGDAEYLNRRKLFLSRPRELLEELAIQSAG